MKTRIFWILAVAAAALAGCERASESRAEARADRTATASAEAREEAREARDAARDVAGAGRDADERDAEPESVAAAGTPAPAAWRSQSRAPTRYADTNNDGRVTKKEAKADPVLAANFDAYDLNDDGDLDRAEFARMEALSAREPGDEDRAASPQPDRARGDSSAMRPRPEYSSPR